MLRMVLGIMVDTMEAGLKVLRMGLRWRIWVGYAKLDGRSSRLGKICCCSLVSVGFLLLRRSLRMSTNSLCCPSFTLI